MRTLFVALVPAVLLIGLIVGALKLNAFVPGDKPCMLGKCPLALHEDDSGKAFYYGVAARFTVYFDEGKNPRENLRCTPEGVVDAASNAPQVAPPLYAATFEGTAAGTCTLTDDHFSATIVVQ
jgi:hypothetical protein